MSSVFTQINITTVNMNI